MSNRATRKPDDAIVGSNTEVRPPGGVPKAVAEGTRRPSRTASRSSMLAPFRVAPVDLGLRDGLRLSDTEDLLDLVEGPRRP